MNNVIFGFGSVDIEKMIELVANEKCGVVVDRIESRNMAYKTKAAESTNRRVNRGYHLQVKNESRMHKNKTLIKK